MAPRAITATIPAVSFSSLSWTRAQALALARPVTSSSSLMCRFKSRFMPYRFLGSRDGVAAHHGLRMVRLEGLEPPTLSLGCSCSILLSYRRKDSPEHDPRVPQPAGAAPSVHQQALHLVGHQLLAAVQEAQL